MDIPFYVLAIAYLVGLAVYGLFLFFNVYHLVRFGMMDSIIKAHVIMMLALTAIIIFFTLLFVREVPWTETFPLFDLQGLGERPVNYE